MSINGFVKNLGEHEAVFNFPSNFFPFQGHFPHQPILPGFMTLATMEWAIPRMLNRSLGLNSIKKAKFTGMVFPEQDLHLILVSFKEKDGLIEVNMEAKVSESLVAKAQLAFEPS